MTRDIHVFAEPSELAAAVADEFIGLAVDWLATQNGPMHIALTGGRTGIATMSAIAAADSSAIDWSRVHVWWGDERWLPAGDAERNDFAADRALLQHIGLPESQIHRVASADAGWSLEEAAAEYRAELASVADPGASAPNFALVFLGVGPDGHVASLFPGHPAGDETELSAIAVEDSPKPPAARVSLTLSVLNRAEHVWLMLSGADKAPAAAEAFGPDSSRSGLPAARVHGRISTVVFTDEAAASLLA